MELSPDLPSALVPLAWLLGTWQGVGVVGYPGDEASGGQPEAQFGQEVTFRHVGESYLVYESRAWRIDAAGAVGETLDHESGYWRPLPDASFELVLSHPSGVVEIYLGEIAPAKLEMSTDVVARTSTGEEHTAGHRLYGLVEGDLLWAYDRAVAGRSLRPYMAARLARVDASESLA